MSDKLRVLVLDDEESIRYSLQRFLKDAGFDVATASRPEEAKALVLEKEFEAAIVDRILSDGQDGLEFIGYLKERQPDCESIVISAFPSFESAAESLRYHTFAYITKPFRKNEICRVVQEAVKHGVLKKERKNSEELFRTLFDMSPEPTVICDVSGKATFVNRAFTRIFGFRTDDVLGGTVPFVPPWDVEESEIQMAMLLAGMAVTERKTQRLAKDGKIIDVLISTAMRRESDSSSKNLIFFLKVLQEPRDDLDV
ncbi:MAG: response regulator [Desulfobacteraceae bacterium]|nr:MAG: response regulator [Desulfobacteraceae bacterium]